MPHDEEASTQNSRLETGGGLDNDDPQKTADSWLRHQLTSARTLGLGVRRVKGEDMKLNEDVKQDMAGKCERPSGSANEQ